MFALISTTIPMSGGKAGEMGQGRRSRSGVSTSLAAPMIARSTRSTPSPAALIPRCRGSNPAAPASQSVSNASHMKIAQKPRGTARFCLFSIISGRALPVSRLVCAGGPTPRRLPVRTVGALAQSKQHSLGRLRGAPCCRGRPLLREHCQCAMDDSGNNGADNRGDHVEPDICEVIGRDHRT
jgi:hypothetical protein